MSDLETILKELARKVVQYPEPDADTYSIRRDIVYKANGEDVLAFDLYLPAHSACRSGFPVVIQLNAFPLPGRARPKWMPSVSWARLLAARGMASIVFERMNVLDDCLVLLDFLRDYGRDLGIDPGRLGLMAFSGLGPAALGLLMLAKDNFTCASLNYPFLMDLDGHDEVARAAAEYGFPDPCVGRQPGDLPRHTRLLITRAGRDAYPGLLAGLDRFVAKAAALGLPVSVIMHDAGVHAFDLEEDSPQCRDVIDRILESCYDCLMK